MTANSKKWKIFGFQFEWFDIKTKFKQLLRKITYSRLFRELICITISGYLRLVYVTSKKIFVNYEILTPLVQNKKSIMFCMWHNRLMMMPLIARKILQDHQGKINLEFMALVSKHGDGRFVGYVMEKFGLTAIFGSTQDKRKASRGIDIGTMRKIFAGLKKGHFIGITPDGPRGPNQKINGEIVNIARLTNSAIVTVSYSSSRFIQLNSWDKFKIPLPFSTLCFYFDEKVICAPKDIDENEIEKIRSILEERMNFVQEKSLELTKNDRRF